MIVVLPEQLLYHLVRLYTTAFLFCPNQVKISDVPKREAQFPTRYTEMQNKIIDFKPQYLFFSEHLKKF